MDWNSDSFKCTSAPDIIGSNLIFLFQFHPILTVSKNSIKYKWFNVSDSDYFDYFDWYFSDYLPFSFLKFLDVFSSLKLWEVKNRTSHVKVGGRLKDIESLKIKWSKWTKNYWQQWQDSTGRDSLSLSMKHTLHTNQTKLTIMMSLKRGPTCFP